MNTAQQVDNLIANWKVLSLTKAELVVKIAEACLGWPYVFGAAGQYDTPTNREARAKSSPAGEGEVIRKRCQVLNGTKSACDGCKYFPSSSKTRCFDCRGFTRWVLSKVNIPLDGAGATSQWNKESNWAAKGLIQDLPIGMVCCVFMQNQKDHKTMEHTGFYIGGDIIIHCSGEVKYGKITDKGWTHFAVPVGLDNDIPIPVPSKPTLRRGSTGEYVSLAQTKLLQLGYDLGSYGVDGKFGAKTEAAVKAFQKVHGVEPDGVIGAKTWELLDGATNKFYTVSIPHLTEYQADALLKNYNGGWKTVENSDQ